MPHSARFCKPGHRLTHMLKRQRVVRDGTRRDNGELEPWFYADKVHITPAAYRKIPRSSPDGVPAARGVTAGRIRVRKATVLTFSVRRSPCWWCVVQLRHIAFCLAAGDFLRAEMTRSFVSGGGMWRSFG